MEPFFNYTRSLVPDLTPEDEEYLNRISDPQDLEDGLLSVRHDDTVSRIQADMMARLEADMLRILTGR